MFQKQRKRYKLFETIYVFVFNSPIIQIDSLGLKTLPKCKTKEGYEPTSNGCGPKDPGWLNWLIPEGTYYGADFGPACDNHDICWGTCGADKSKCNAQFLKDLKKQCDEYVNEVYGPGGTWDWIPDGRIKNKLKEIDRKACYIDAKSFEIGVTNPIADGAFKDAQIEACECYPCEP